MVKGIVDKGDKILFEYRGIKRVGLVKAVTANRESFFVEFEDKADESKWLTREHLFKAEVIEITDGETTSAEKRKKRK